MKSSRKIWSIPIAALALVLMLVGALAVSGIVQANTVHGVTLTDPDGSEVTLTLVALETGVSGADRATVPKEFRYDENVRVGTEFTVAVSGGREITNRDATHFNTDDDPAQPDMSMAKVTSVLDHDAVPMMFDVEHDYPDDDARQVSEADIDEADNLDEDDLTLRTLSITLTLQNAPPVVEIPIEDSPWERGAGVLPTASYSPTLSTALTDPNGDGDALTFTAFTNNPKVATVTLTGNQDGAAPTTGTVQAWWDLLDCAEKNAVLGLKGNKRDRDDTDEIGICQLYGDVDLVNENVLKVTITQAFHWNMLTGPEMEYAAKAGGLSNPAGYKAPFADLSTAEREGLVDLRTRNILVDGTGGFAVNRVNTGSADITVKVSDPAGRFLAKSVGDTFSVSTPLMIIGPVNGTTTEVDDDPPPDGADGIQIKTNLSGVAAGQAGADVITITTDVIVVTDGPAFLITGADAGSFYATRSSDSGVITTAGVLAAGTYEFTVTAAVHGVDAAADVIVSVGHTNRAPEVVSGSTTSFTILEQGQDGAVADAVVIHDFMANFMDPDREVDLDFEIEAVDDEDEGAVALLNNIRFDGSALKTKPVSFAWDDPEENRKADNEHAYKVTVSDASGLSASQNITIAITNYIPPPPTPEPSTDIMVDENVTSDDEDAAAAIEIRDESGELLVDGYAIIAQSPKGLVEDGEDPGDDPDSGDIWEAVDGDDAGELRLIEGALPPDFENPDYPNRYIIAVEAGPDGDKTVEAFTVVIQDINEAPAFEINKDNGAGNPKGIAIDIAETGDDPEWALYVLETTINGGPVGEVRDTDGNLSDDTTPGQLSAVDPDGDAITYTLMDWTDNGSDDGDGIVDENELTAHTGPFSIDSSGNVTVSGILDADAATAKTVYPLQAVATDDDADEALSGTFDFTLYVVDSNEPPVFDNPSTDGRHCRDDRREFFRYLHGL